MSLFTRDLPDGGPAGGFDHPADRRRARLEFRTAVQNQRSSDLAVRLALVAEGRATPRDED